MVREYTTKSGDKWDEIAFAQMGSCRYTDELINANRQHIDVFIFSAGTKLVIPEIDTTTRAELPPWRK